MPQEDRVVQLETEVAQLRKDIKKLEAKIDEHIEKTTHVHGLGICLGMGN